MQYRLSAGRLVRDTVPAIAASQLDAAVACLKAGQWDGKAVHSARKHFKRVRALLGLVEPAAHGKKVKTSRTLITAAAQMLAPGRDAQVALAAAEALEKDFATAGTARAFADLTAFLKARRDRTGEALNHAGLESVFQQLEDAKASLGKLNLKHAQMSDLLDSAAATYGKGRRAMKAALESGEEEALHDWRKLTQRHWRHMLLLQEAWPEEAKARIALARRLSDVLGENNDLAVLRETICANRMAFSRAGDAKMLCRCIETKQQKLAGKAALRGERLYAEKPKAFARRLRIYWHSAKVETPSAEREARPRLDRNKSASTA
jgi:CHAD domain-containing protein